MTSPTKQPKPDYLPRSFRGGSSYHPSANGVRGAYRDADMPLIRNNDIGFRTVQSGARQPVGKVTP